MLFLFCFFFFKQKTAYEMRISDWSSDVCSSDLLWARRRRGTGVGGPYADASGDARMGRAGARRKLARRKPRGRVDGGGDDYRGFSGALNGRSTVIASGAKQSRAVYARAGFPRRIRPPLGRASCRARGGPSV